MVETKRILGIEIGPIHPKMKNKFRGHGDVDVIKLKIPTFLGKNDPKTFKMEEKYGLDFLFP